MYLFSKIEEKKGTVMKTQRVTNLNTNMNQVVNKFESQCSFAMKRLQKETYMEIDKQMTALNELDNNAWSLEFKDENGMQNVPVITKSGSTKNWIYSLAHLDLMQRYHLQNLLGAVSQAQGMGFVLSYKTKQK